MAAVNVNPKALISPKTILRLLEIFFAIICFAILADRFHGMDVLRADIAFGVVTFIWALACIPLYLFSSMCAAHIRFVCLFELIVDSGLTFYGVVVNIVFSTKINKYWADAYRASNAFGYLTTIALILSCVLDIVSVIRPPDVGGSAPAEAPAPA